MCVCVCDGAQGHIFLEKQTGTGSQVLSCGGKPGLGHQDVPVFPIFHLLTMVPCRLLPSPPPALLNHLMLLQGKKRGCNLPRWKESGTYLQSNFSTDLDWVRDNGLGRSRRTAWTSEVRGGGSLCWGCGGLPGQDSAPSHPSLPSTVPKVGCCPWHLSVRAGPSWLGHPLVKWVAPSSTVLQNRVSGLEIFRLIKGKA